MRAADYAPPGFFTAHPLVPGFQLRDRFIGLDMDLHADELMAAYKYEARPHVRNEVVKDGLNIRVQARRLYIRKYELATPTRVRTARTLCSSCRSASLLACPALRAACAAVGSCLRSTAACLSAAAPVQFRNTARPCHHWLSCR